MARWLSCSRANMADESRFDKSNLQTNPKTMTNQTLFPTLLLLVLAAHAASADRPRLAPLQLDAPPVVDGALDDACWQQAAKIELSPMRDEDKAIPATTVQAAYTTDAAYFAFTCIEPHPEKLKKGDPGRGDAWVADSVELFLDTDGDQSDYSQFNVSAGETWAANFCERPWVCLPVTGDWKFKARVGKDCYTAEVELPFSQFPRKQELLTPTWNVAFCRYRYLDSATAQYAVWGDARHHSPKIWGELGPVAVDFAAVTGEAEKGTGPGGWEYITDIPPTYSPNFPRELDPSLQWIKKERLRIAWSWLTGVTKLYNNPQTQYRVQDMVDLIASSGCNVIQPTASAKTKKETPYYFWATFDAMVRVRLAGARTMYNISYIWGKDHDPAMKFRRQITAKGEVVKAMICPRDPHPWRDNLVAPTLDALKESKRLGVPDLFFGVMFDIEPQANIDGYCYCDDCWRGYAKARGVASLIDPNVTPKDRQFWLLMNQKLNDYQAWQERAVTEMIRAEMKAVRRVAPAMVFGYYPHQQEVWWFTRAAAAGVSTPRAPAILMDDTWYYSGYSGQPRFMDRVRRKATEYLGHEPFYSPSIIYGHTEKNYPTYTVERAAREVYLFTKTAVSMITYANSCDTGKDMLEDQREFYTDGFAKAHKLLENEGVIDQAAPKPPTGRERKRLERALAKLQTEVASMWGNVYGVSGQHVDAPASGAFDGAPVTITKHLKTSIIPNTDSADYVFDLDLPARPTTAKLVIAGKPRVPELTNLRVEVNGEKVAYLNRPFGPDGRIEIAVPARLIKKNTTVRLAYFLGDSYAETRFDNSVIVERIDLTLSP